MELKYSRFCAALFLAAWLWAAPAEAHSIYVFAYQDAAQICTNSYFGGKAKVRGGTVSMIAAATGEVLATAITDEKGDACFAKPEAQELLFRVEASGGHQGEFILPASDVVASEQDSGVKLKDIIGGLGWLIGLAGAALWVDSRKKRG